jgi:cell division protein FtsW
MNQFLSKYLKGDLVIWGVILILSLFGILAVYSSTSTLAWVKNGGNVEAYLFKHVAYLFLGLFVMWLTHLVDIQYFSRISQLLLVISVFLLVYTLLFGTSINSAKRWVSIPIINLTIQSSDVAKLALVAYIARFLAKKQSDIGDYKKAFLPILGVIFLVCMLIFPEDASTSVVLFTTSFVLLFIGRIPIKQLAIFSFSGLIIFGALGYYIWNNDVDFGRLGTVKKRMETFVDGGDASSSFQSDQAKIAIARGEFIGRGPGRSIQKNFLPSPFADFIYAVIIEEYGSIVGGLGIIFLYLLLLYRSFRILIRTQNSLAAMMALGLSFSLVFQAMINMAVAVNLLPVTGLALPLISRGGTSIFFTCITLGIILSASRTIYSEREQLETTDHE